jgi:hypothetical protein
MGSRNTRAGNRHCSAHCAEAARLHQLNAIFRASILKTLDDGLQAANGILDDDRLVLEETRLKALDEWFGRHIGLLDSEASDLVEQCERVLGDAVGKSRSAFQEKLEKVILARSARKTKGADKRAATIGDMLCTCGDTWKPWFLFTTRIRRENARRNPLVLSRSMRLGDRTACVAWFRCQEVCGNSSSS